MRRCIVVLGAAALSVSCASTTPSSTSTSTSTGAGAASASVAREQFEALAQRAVAHQLDYAPILAYFTGLPAPDHRRWPDRSAQAIEAFERTNDQLLAELRRIDPAALPPGSATYDILKEQLESEAQLRVCRSELWEVSHMNGWHLAMVSVAQEQPVGTADERAQALQRWGAAPRAIDQEITNLRRGLSAGYSAPKSVVQRVIKQIGGLAGAAPDKSPLASPAARSDDAPFKAAFQTLIAEQVNPALQRYKDYLEKEYLPKARDALAVVANPNGKECYQASLRSYTTLDRSPQEVFDIGRSAVERNAAVVADLGERKFGTRDLAAIIRRVKEAPDNHFASQDELVAFSRAVVDRARTQSAPLFAAMPGQVVLVEPFREFMLGSGASSHYESQVDASKPAYYRIATDTWSDETRGAAEITAMHEAYPGHHMQISFARMLEQSPVSKLSFNSAYLEGWARYSEMLAEEAGMYDTDYALISRRIWPARGMVADPGMHVLGWSREETTQYLRDTGRFSQQESEDLVDRMAVLPGQLTAYDSGGLEIMALRERARRELGERFDIRDFHQVVLGQGVVPLGTLRRNVDAWIARRKAGEPRQ